MMAPNHALFGVTAYTALPLVGVDAPLAGLTWALYGALIPDIDHHTSWAAQLVDPWGRWFKRLLGVKHRGITHHWWFLVVVLAGALVFSTSKGRHDDALSLIPFGVGWASHIIGDEIPDTGGNFEWKIVRPLLWLAFFAVLVWAHLLGRSFV